LNSTYFIIDSIHCAVLRICDLAITARPRALHALSSLAIVHGTPKTAVLRVFLSAIRARSGGQARVELRAVDRILPVIAATLAWANAGKVVEAICASRGSVLQTRRAITPKCGASLGGRRCIRGKATPGASIRSLQSCSVASLSDIEDAIRRSTHIADEEESPLATIRTLGVHKRQSSAVIVRSHELEGSDAVLIPLRPLTKARRRALTAVRNGGRANADIVILAVRLRAEHYANESIYIIIVDLILRSEDALTRRILRNNSLR
jgi:hypothetical protein